MTLPPVFFSTANEIIHYRFGRPAAYRYGVTGMTVCAHTTLNIPMYAALNVFDVVISRKVLLNIRSTISRTAYSIF